MPYDVEKSGDVSSIKEKLEKTYKSVSDTAARQAIHVFNSVLEDTGDEGKAWASVYSKMNERGLSKKSMSNSDLSDTLLALAKEVEARHPDVKIDKRGPRPTVDIGSLLLVLDKCLDQSARDPDRARKELGELKRHLQRFSSTKVAWTREFKNADQIFDTILRLVSRLERALPEFSKEVGDLEGDISDLAARSEIYYDEKAAL